MYYLLVSERTTAFESLIAAFHETVVASGKPDRAERS
jgi:hypothetical protein